MSMIINVPTTSGGNSDGVFTSLDVSGGITDIDGDLDVSGIANLDKIKIGYTIDKRDSNGSYPIHLYCDNQSYKVFQIRSYEGNSHNFDIKNVQLNDAVLGGQYIVILKVEDNSIDVDSITPITYIRNIYTDFNLKLPVTAGSYCLITYFVVSDTDIVASVSTFKDG